MKVSELIEWLKTQDQEAIVEILVGEHSRGYSGDSFSKEFFDINEHVDYTDFRKYDFAKGQPYENDRLLFLGSY